MVVLSSPQPQNLVEVTDALIGGEQYTQALQGSLVVINGRNVESLVAEQAYYVGHLGPFRYIQWLLSQHVPALLLLTLLGVALVSLVAFFSLRAQAKRRLNIE